MDMNMFETREHCTGNRRVLVRFPFKSEFFFRLNFHNCLSCVHNCDGIYIELIFLTFVLSIQNGRTLPSPRRFALLTPTPPSTNSSLSPPSNAVPVIRQVTITYRGRRYSYNFIKNGIKQFCFCFAEISRITILQVLLRGYFLLLRI